VQIKKIQMRLLIMPEGCRPMPHLFDALEGDRGAFMIVVMMMMMMMMMMMISPIFLCAGR